jgi:hypothetical protein
MVFAKKGAPALKSAKIDSKRVLYGIVSECFRSPMYAEGPIDSTCRKPPTGI